MLLSIIIVNYNVKYFVEQCLRSIYCSQGIDLTEVEIFVVDNLSRDGSVEFLKKRFPKSTHPRLQIIVNKRNVGFGRANNQALRRAKGQYILFLNPDTLLTEHTLLEILTLAQAQARVGAVGVKMLHSNGRFAPESRRGVPTPWAAFCKITGLSRLLPKSRIFGRYYMQHLPLNEPCPIDIVSGACMLIPSAVLKQVGGFDEQFFMYGEDIDLSYRLLQGGYTNFYSPTTILHYKGESTQKNTYHYVHVFYSAMLIFFRKHFKQTTPLLSLPIKCAILCSALLSLSSKQMLNLRNFLFPSLPYPKNRMLYLGQHPDDIRQIAEDYGLDIDLLDATERTHPNGHAGAMPYNPQDYLHIVYDLQDYSTAAVLEIFEKNTRPHLYLGTYSPRTHTLITGSKTYVGSRHSSQGPRA